MHHLSTKARKSDSNRARSPFDDAMECLLSTSYKGLMYGHVGYSSNSQKHIERHRSMRICLMYFKIILNLLSDAICTCECHTSLTTIYL